jgi:hypothetical protein
MDFDDEDFGIALQMMAEDDPPQLNVYNFNSYGTNNGFPRGDVSTPQNRQNEIARIDLQRMFYTTNPLNIVNTPETLNTILNTINTILRDLRNPGSANINPVDMTGDGLRKATRWTDFVRKYAKENKIPYGCALSKASEEYKKHKGIVKNIKTSIGRKEEYAKRYLGSTVGEGFGTQAGEALADDIGRKTGYGIRNRVLRKGSSIVRR